MTVKTFKDVNGVKTQIGDLVSIVGYGKETYTSIYPVKSIRRGRGVIEVVLYDPIAKHCIQTESKDVYNEA